MGMEGRFTHSHTLRPYQLQQKFGGRNEIQYILTNVL